MKVYATTSVMWMSAFLTGAWWREWGWWGALVFAVGFVTFSFAVAFRDRFVLDGAETSPRSERTLSPTKGTGS